MFRPVSKGAELKKVPVTDEYTVRCRGHSECYRWPDQDGLHRQPEQPDRHLPEPGEYERLVNGIPDDVLLIADEAYYEYTTDVEDYPPALDYRRDNVIVLRTFSKAYGLADFG
jgi:histidinol-phosphate aminotransferase